MTSCYLGMTSWITVGGYDEDDDDDGNDADDDEDGDDDVADDDDGNDDDCDYDDQLLPRHDQLDHCWWCRRPKSVCTGPTKLRRYD